MIDILGLVAIGVAAFVATDIDDIFILMMFFSSLTFPVRQVILGQFMGIGLLIVISALGSLITLVIPTYVIGLIGIAPMAIGIKNLIEIRKKNKSPSRQVVGNKKNKSSLSYLEVAAVT
jgi:cadmium resistance protein CadD (predicted permease)